MSEKGVQHTESGIQEMLYQSNQAVAKAMVALFKQQTPTERELHMSFQRDGKGVGKFDAPFVSHVAEEIMQGKSRFSQRQIDYMRKVAIRYKGQLTRIANGEQ